MPSFVRVNTDAGPILLNLDAIVDVDEIMVGHCRISFSNGPTCEVIGKGADTLVGHLLKHVVLEISSNITYLEPAPLEPLDPSLARIPRFPEGL